MSLLPSIVLSGADFLFEGVADRVAQKAAHIAQTDPDGLILTLVSVSVVFGALIILFAAYSISGRIFTKGLRPSGRIAGKIVPGRIASSLRRHFSDSEELDDDECAAVALALHLYISGGESGPDGVHDDESGVITIRRHFRDL